MQSFMQLFLFKFISRLVGLKYSHNLVLGVDAVYFSFGQLDFPEDVSLL